MPAPKAPVIVNVTVTNPLALLRAVRDKPQEGCLVMIYPPDGGLTKLSSKDEVVIGRCPNCHLVLDDESVSRRHAAIMRRRGAFVITDLSSTNGTMVGEACVDERELTAGDQIRIGNHILKFLSADGIERQYHETVYSMMTTDALTSAWTKQYLVEALERDLLRKRHQQQCHGLMMLDLDHFKRINDTYGHLVGDEVLKEFAARCRSETSPEDVFARFGGEEFALLISDREVNCVGGIAERVRASIADRPFKTSSGLIDVTVSIGVVHTSRVEACTAKELLHLADEQLYQAKERGRNRVVS